MGSGQVGGQSLLAHIRESEDEIVLGDRFQEILEYLGFSHYFYTLLHEDGQRLYMIKSTYPEEVRHFWSRTEIRNNDPLLPHLARSVTPIRRSDIKDDGEWAAEVFGAIRRAKAGREAWHFPVHDSTDLIGLFTITTNDDIANRLGDDHFAETELILPALCVQAHETWRRLTATPPEALKPELKDKEIKILDWLSLGKSTEDIAEIMDLSERTVNYHVTQIKDKLMVGTRAHAVAMAIRLGVI